MVAESFTFLVTKIRGWQRRLGNLQDGIMNQRRKVVLKHICCMNTTPSASCPRIDRQTEETVTYINVITSCEHVISCMYTVLHIIHAKNTSKIVKGNWCWGTTQVGMIETVMYQIYKFWKKTDWAVSSPCKFKSTASGKWAASFFPISQAVDLFHWFSAGLSKRSDPSRHLIETPNSDLPMGPPQQGSQSSLSVVEMFLKNMWVTDMRTSNLLPQPFQTKPNGNYIESLKMKGITASPVELVDCESFETNTGISTLLKPQLYKGRNIFAFTPEKSIHFVALLCNTPNQHNQREPSKPTLFPSHGQTWNLSDKHTDWWIEELIDSVLVWWRVLQGENGMPSRSLRNFQSLKRLDETKVFASKSKLRYPF